MAAYKTVDLVARVQFPPTGLHKTAREEMKPTIIASYATDIVEGKPRRGGPALFITKALEEMGIEYDIYSTEGIVEIDKEERGTVKRAGKITAPDAGEMVLISTLLDEYELRPIGKFNCVDVQGYVRAGRKTDLSGFDIIKGTEKELEGVKTTGVRGIIIKTKGEEGFEIIEKDKRTGIKGRKIECKDTIGAGDTLFTAFCVRYYKTRDVKISAEYAKRTVEKFLARRR